MQTSCASDMTCRPTFPRHFGEVGVVAFSVCGLQVDMRCQRSRIGNSKIRTDRDQRISKPLVGL